MRLDAEADVAVLLTFICHAHSPRICAGYPARLPPILIYIHAYPPVLLSHRRQFRSKTSKTLRWREAASPVPLRWNFRFLARQNVGAPKGRPDEKVR
jgi:hypothetical protein